MSKTIYRFEVNFGRHGTVEGVFAATGTDVAKAIGRHVYFEEPFGKHSSAETTLAAEHFTPLSSAPFDLEVFERLGLRHGHNPLSWLDDNEPGWRS